MAVSEGEALPNAVPGGKCLSVPRSRQHPDKRRVGGAAAVSRASKRQEEALSRGLGWGLKCWLGSKAMDWGCKEGVSFMFSHF